MGTMNENLFSGCVQPLRQCFVAALLLAACGANPEDSTNGEPPLRDPAAPATPSREEPKSPNATANAILTAHAPSDRTPQRAQTAIADPAQRDDALGPPRVTRNDVDDWTMGGDTLATVKQLGTNNAIAFEIEVNNARAMRYEPNAASPIIIGGHSSNWVNSGLPGITIAGGGYLGGANSVQANGQWGTICGGAANTVWG